MQIIFIPKFKIKITPDNPHFYWLQANFWDIIAVFNPI